MGFWNNDIIHSAKAAGSRILREAWQTGVFSMVILILACIVSFIPYTVLYLWLRNRINKDEAYKKLCDKSLLRGFLSTFAVIFLSAISNILINLTGLREANPILYRAIYDFIVIALMEEIAKYLAFRRVLKKSDHPYSWLDATVFMTAVSIGFGFLEAIVYSIGASVPVVLIRGFSLPHAGYGFLEGYFYGKGSKEGNTVRKWTGFVLAWFFHGLYDFSLSKEFSAINDNLVFIPFILVLLDILFVVNLIVFVKRAKIREDCLEPLPESRSAQMPAQNGNPISTEGPKIS